MKTVTAFFVLCTALAGQVPPGMAPIPAGPFVMGDVLDDGNPSEQPVHTVYVSAFYMDRYDVTKAVWDNVYQWAVTHGYGFDNAGSGKAANHPVHSVNWYDAVKWSNARSEKEGLAPCYYTDANHKTVYRTGQINLSNASVKWTSCGYRLPTGAEWEKAARGGVSGRRFPWADSDTITHSQANYYSSARYKYDISPTRGYHPKFNDGVPPYTSPVGYFPPNGYGLYDMAGNIWQWCWDRTDNNWYRQPGATEKDPRGPDASPAGARGRMMRGGAFHRFAFNTRAANLSLAGDAPDFAFLVFGFRCVMTAREKAAPAAQPSGLMAKIPAGPFDMGDILKQGPPNEQPVHTVYVSAFLMDRHDVTKALWDEVYEWAVQHGYRFENAGWGKAANHPVHTVNWYDAVKWSNARSEKERLRPCYYTDAGRKTVYRSGQIDLANTSVDWAADGYRLPTEAEWEKAARGGMTGRRFPWEGTNTITHSQANYYSSTLNSYDVSPTRGYHPAFYDGVYPFTNPVDYFPPNGYGLYDMAGNIWQWCWDLYDAGWYKKPGASAKDTRGPESNQNGFRVMRGGSWHRTPNFARWSHRGQDAQDLGWITFGFRCVRGSSNANK